MIASDTKNNSIAAYGTRSIKGFSDIVERLPFGIAHVLEPCLKGLLAIGVQLPKTPQGFFGDDPHGMRR